MKNMIYLDNAATTQVKPEVADAMMPYFHEKYGNPSSLYEIGVENKEAINEARVQLAQTIGAKDGEIYFTSGGTESDNWALRSTAESYSDKGKHIITSTIEHHAIAHTCEYLEKKGYEITYINVDDCGMIKINELKNAIRKDTILISVMFANNEVGTIEPVEEIARIAKQADVLFHTDAVQAYCHVPIHVKKLGIDMLSASAHKFGGPKGVGFLYVREGILLSPMMFGGAQERTMRAGTENVPGIVGMAEAAKLSHRYLTGNMERERRMRDYLVKRVMREIPFVRFNGSKTSRLPGNASFSFGYVDGQTLVVMLDMEGVCVSSGSACSSSSHAPSHVLTAMGIPESTALATLRLTIGADTTRDEVDKTVNALKKIVAQLRSKSADYQRALRKNYWR